MSAPFDVAAVRAELAAASARVTFEPEAHAYTLDGHPVPSVTQVLRRFLPPDFGQVPAAMLERKRQIGNAAHHATHLSDLGVLDETTVETQVRGYLKSWWRFLIEHPIEILATEVRLGHPFRRYAGTIDKIAWRHSPAGTSGRLMIVDLKTGDPKAARTHLQTGGYEELILANLARILPWSGIERLGVQLDPEGGPAKVTPYTNRFDRRRFLALRDALAIIEEEAPDAAVS